MKKHQAIYNLYPNVVVIREDVAYDKDENVVEYDEVLVLKEMQSKEYIDKRAMEYPSFADQFDLLYHGGIDAWKTEIDKVKNKYPKP